MQSATEATSKTRRAKIVCTLGPASLDRETITALTRAGMSVARFNASHGTPEDRRELIERVQAVDAETASPLATLLDLPGPEIRTAETDDTATVQTGTTVTFDCTDEITAGRIGLSTSIERVTPGDRVLLDDGRIETTVIETDGKTVTANVESGGEIGGRAGVNVPGVDLGLPTVTETDKQELDIAANKQVDFVAASFIKSGADILEISAQLEGRGADIPIIAKVERADAVENIESIIDAADGVMVARGDLGVECPLEDVPIIQKRLIKQCRLAGVPVITATEMLDSMIEQRRPTRAEASDVANAVLDGTDAVMLSGETAIGKHPVRVVETMDRIIRDVEESDEYTEVLEERVPPAGETRTDALSRSARYLARDINAQAIVAASESGYTARKAAKYRPEMPIVAATPDDRTRRRLALTWGIIPKHVSQEGDSAGTIIQEAVQAALETETANSGDTVVVLSGMMTEYSDLDTANTLKVHVASERLVSGRPVVEGFATGPVYRAAEFATAPDGAIIAVPEEFSGEFDGDLSKIDGIIDAHRGMTSYAAILAREIDVPMVSYAQLPNEIESGRELTLDAERGVVYADPVE